MRICWGLSGELIDSPERLSMFSIPGRSLRTCEGLSRREWLRLGGLSSVGLGLDGLLAGRADARAATGQPSSFGRAKSCIVLFMFGAPAHQDSWDMKPEAPSEVRSEFSSIPSTVPGISVCEHLPLLARHTDQLAQLRSVTHPDNTHTVAMHYMLTGVRHRRPETNPQHALDDFPCFGAVVNHVDDGPAGDGLPRGISLNAPANQVSANNHIFPGFFGGFLGAGTDPLFISQHPNDKSFSPFPPVDRPRRLLDRQRLLARLDGQARLAEREAAVESTPRR